MTTLKNKKIKSKLPVKDVKAKLPIKMVKPKSLPVKTVKAPTIKTVKAPVKPKSVKSKVKLIVEFDKADKADNPSKYIDKLKKLVFKIKNQTLETDNRIRFGWNY